MALIVISSFCKGGPIMEICSTLNRTLAFYVPKLVTFWTLYSTNNS